jgi:hypothetical protein
MNSGNNELELAQSALGAACTRCVRTRRADVTC